MKLQFLATLLGCCGLWAAFDGASHSAELPKLSVHGPTDNTRFDTEASIGFAGDVTPPLHTQARVHLYRDLGEGNLLPMGGASVPLDPKGRFIINLLAPLGDWPEGKALAIVSLDGLKQIQKRIELEFFALPNAGQASKPIRLPESSGKAFDLRHDAQGVVPPGKTFLVRGLVAGAGDEQQGPYVMAKLVPVQGRLAGVTICQELGISLPEQEGNFFFEVQVKAPTEPGHYLLKVTGSGKQQVGEMQIFVSGGKADL